MRSWARLFFDYVEINEMGSVHHHAPRHNADDINLQGEERRGNITACEYVQCQRLADVGGPRQPLGD